MLELPWPRLQRGHLEHPLGYRQGQHVPGPELRLEIIMAWFKQNLAQREFLWCRH